MNTDRIALQLYTVRDATASDFLGTLRQLGEMGYRAVEFAGYGNTPVSELRAALDEYGIRAMGAHVPLSLLEAEPAKAFEQVGTLGCEYVVVPFVPEERRDSVNSVRKLAEVLNRLGEQSRSEGYRFGYHNHAMEFEPLDGTTMYDILTSETDPELVALELDLFWAQYGGVDPLELLSRYSDRVPLLHLKDMQEDGRSDAPVGEGILPWNELLSAGARAGAEWYIVEQDNPQDPMEDVRASLRNLEQMDEPA